MAFPNKVREEALVACGRRCSICHKFCGIKIELHHIVEQSNGGPDTFDNCIPLCFDCHADMRSYDHQHPKGLKYSRTELKRHRDAWYKKVKGSGPIVAQPDYTEVDRDLFSRIREILPWRGSMEFLEENNFAGFSFRLDSLQETDHFLYECKDPAFEFMDGDLESARADLEATLREFNKIIAFETFPAGTSGYNTVPPEWEEEQPDRFQTTVSALHQLSTRAVDQYRSLVKLARRKLAPPRAGT